MIILPIWQLYLHFKSQGLIHVLISSCLCHSQCLQTLTLTFLPICCCRSSFMKHKFYLLFSFSKAFKYSSFPVESSLTFLSLLGQSVLNPHGNLHSFIHFAFLQCQTEVYDLIHSTGQLCLLPPCLHASIQKAKLCLKSLTGRQQNLGSDSQARQLLEINFPY